MNNDYPNTPGFVDVDTSEAAAERLEPSVETLRGTVLRAISNSPQGLTCDEVEVLLALRHQTASARCRELELLGWLVKTDGKRVTRSGRGARVYRRTEPRNAT